MKVNISKDFMIGWLKGIFDGEGGLQYSRYRAQKQWHTTKRVVMCNTAIEIIELTKKYLKYLDIDFRIGYYTRKDKSKPIYVIYIERRDAIKKYAELIGFLEKRKSDLLIKIIDSFDNRHKPTKEELEDLYTNKYMSSVDIGRKFGLSVSAINQWMKKLNVKHRSLSEIHKLVWLKRKNPSLAVYSFT